MHDSPTTDVSQLNAEARGLRVIGHTDLNGSGDAMHVNFYDKYAYVGHMGDRSIGTSVVDISDPTNPRVVYQMEKPDGVRTHKVQILGDILLVNQEIYPNAQPDPALPTGFKVFSLEDPTRPNELAYYHMPGHGVHRFKYIEEPYVYMSGSDLGFDRQIFMIFDLSDPANPVEVSRWWLPGMNHGAGEESRWHSGRDVWHHHANIVGDRAYCSWWDGGVVILDISDKSAPKLVKHIILDDLASPPQVSGSVHSVLPIPERNLLIVTEEEIVDDLATQKKYVRVFDISDEQRPRQISILPEPQGDFHTRGGRFGPHNLHEMRAGTYQSVDEVFVTYFSAGVRVYDLSDPFSPRELAYHVPPSPDGKRAIQMNDLIVNSDGLIYATDRHDGGMYIFERTDDWGVR
ncbi:hypothetical protein [Cryobacterium sp. BB307]|uniref:LVIVD repeat-containing protein n=1 Tax=Cryobacterium sp. BB307 TaxID=2716317 RepID=UPI001447B36E|nr:hypothetical protein [Cryobacterium sp. BB307]